MLSAGSLDYCDFYGAMTIKRGFRNGIASRAAQREEKKIRQPGRKREKQRARIASPIYAQCEPANESKTHTHTEYLDEKSELHARFFSFSADAEKSETKLKKRKTWVEKKYWSHAQYLSAQIHTHTPQ